MKYWNSTNNFLIGFKNIDTDSFAGFLDIDASSYNSTVVLTNDTRRATIYETEESANEVLSNFMKELESICEKSPFTQDYVSLYKPCLYKIEIHEV